MPQSHTTAPATTPARQQHRSQISNGGATPLRALATLLPALSIAAAASALLPASAQTQPQATTATVQTTTITVNMPDMASPPAHTFTTEAGTSTTQPTQAAEALSAPAAKPVSKEQARAFLANYPGAWEGNSTVQSIDGQFRTVISVRIDYQADPQKPDEINGRAVFAVGQQTIFATSRTFYADGGLHCTIERDGLQELYIGRISADGKSVTWRSQDRPNALQSYSKETFSTLSGGRPSELIIEGYEDYRDQGAIMTQKTVLTRAAR